MSKHASSGGDGTVLLDLLSRLRAKAEQFAGRSVETVVIREAGLDGFWIHRLLEAHGIESRRRSGIDRRATPTATCENRCSRRRNTAADDAGMAAW